MGRISAPTLTVIAALLALTSSMRSAFAVDIALADGTRIKASSDGWELTHETLRANGTEYARDDVLGVDFKPTDRLNSEFTNRAEGDRLWLAHPDRSYARPFEFSSLVGIIPHWSGVEDSYTFLVLEDECVKVWTGSFERGEWIRAISFGTEYRLKLVRRAFDGSAELLEAYRETRRWAPMIDLAHAVQRLLAGMGDAPSPRLQKQLDKIDELFADRSRAELYEAGKRSDGILMDDRDNSFVMAEEWILTDDEIRVDRETMDRSDVRGIMYQRTSPYAPLQKYIDEREAMQIDAVLTRKGGRDYVLECALFARAPMGDGDAVFFVLHAGAFLPLPTAYPDYTGDFGGVVFAPKYKSPATDAVWAATARDLKKHVDEEDWAFVLPVQRAWRNLADHGLKIGASLARALDDVDQLLEDRPAIRHLGRAALLGMNSGQYDTQLQKMVGRLTVVIMVTDTEWAPDGLVLRLYWTDGDGTLRWQEWTCDLNKSEPRVDALYHSGPNSQNQLGYEDAFINTNLDRASYERVELRIRDEVIASRLSIGASEQDWDAATEGADWELDAENSVTNRYVSVSGGR